MTRLILRRCPDTLPRIQAKRRDGFGDRQVRLARRRAQSPYEVSALNLLTLLPRGITEKKTLSRAGKSRGLALAPKIALR